jgi:hypothetical protein
LVRILDAVEGKGAPLSRRLLPVLVAMTGVVVYGGIFVVFVLERS